MLHNPANELFELSPIKAMELAAAKIPGVISLAQGIPSFQTPQVIKEFVTEKMNSGLVDKYSLTTGLAELREDIAQALQKEGLNYDPDSEILVTVGSIEGITASLLAVTSPGDEVIIPSPTYASYRGAIGLARCEPRYVALNEDQNFDFDVSKIEQAISRRTKAILFCSPNNPTGTVYSEAKTRAMMALAQKHNLAVIIDEVYKDFYYAGEKHFTPALIPEARPNVIRVLSFSKAFSMTGWRVGFLHADAGLVKRCLKYHDAMVTCAPVISQYAAIAALRFGEPYLKEFMTEFKRRRDYTIERLDALSHVLDYQTPRASYFVFPRLKDTVPLAHNSHQLAYDILDKVGLALVPGSAFGPTGESHLRISYGRAMPDIEAGLDRLTEYFANGRARYRLLVPGSATDFKHNNKSLARRLALPLLGWAARFQLSRSRPLIIGVVGTKGKTVFKRTITDLLENWQTTRANILSYNTDIGFPLSILGITRPRDRKERLFLPLKVLARLFSAPNLPKVLVLEYGVDSAADAEWLAKIARPDWLIVTDLAAEDPNQDRSSFIQGLSLLMAGLPAEKIFWCGSELAKIGLDSYLLESQRLSLSDLKSDRLLTPKQSYILGRETLGHSGALAVLGATRIAEALKVPEEVIQSWLDARLH